jgi:hypothetical protein
LTGQANVGEYFEGFEKNCHFEVNKAVVSPLAYKNRRREHVDRAECVGLGSKEIGARCNKQKIDTAMQVNSDDGWNPLGLG